MKKSFLFLCTMLCSMAMSAQLVSSHSASLTKSQSKTQWMVRLGIGSNTFAGDNCENLDSKFGYFVGFEFNKSIGQKGAYWGEDFAFASRGNKSSNKVGSVEATSTFTAHTFHWSPFIFGWKIGVPNSKFAIDPHLGIYLAADMAGKSKSEVKQGGKTQENTTKIGDMDDYNRLGAGLKVGVGVWFNNKYNFDLTYQRGFLGTKIDAGNGESNFMVRLGYAF